MSACELSATAEQNEKKNVINNSSCPAHNPVSTPHHQFQSSVLINNTLSKNFQPQQPTHPPHQSVHTPIQVPRCQESRPSLPTLSSNNSSSPPSELTSQQGQPRQQQGNDASLGSPLARSQSAMEADRSPDPNHVYAPKHSLLFSPQPIRSSTASTTTAGMAIGIAMPHQFSLHSQHQPTKTELVERIEEEMELVVGSGSGHAPANRSGALDSIISDVVESLAQDRENSIVASGDNRPNVQPPPAVAHPQRNSRTFFRAPGLEAPNVEAVAGAADSNIWICPVCGFSCSSKFHYNSHMNTHSDHQCPMCNYTSRTEGRLRKHVKESHTREQRAAAGIADPLDATGNHEASTSSNNEQMSTTMASIFDMVNRAAAAAQPGNEALLKMADGGHSQPDFNNGSSVPARSALDHIRALTERNLLSDQPHSNEMLNGANNMLLMANGGDATRSTPVQQNATQTPSKRAGKPKSYKCKTCDHVSRSKDEQWMHARLHIPPDKQLTCKQCNFVTEYKHHLEYHYRNHVGSKPFQCTHPMCHYQCVNKSMLNSHMKSHTKVYQFKCLDCTYQTKYCHSLKMHLRKYTHRRAPGALMDSDSHDEEMPESDDSGNNTLLQQHIQQQLQQGLQDQFGIGTTASNTTTSGDEDHPSSNGSLSKQEEVLLANRPVPIHHPTLNSILLQPMSASASGVGHSNMVATSAGGSSAIQQYASHLLLRQQQLEMIRAGMLQCTHCDFQTPNNEEMVRHNIHHLLMSHQQQQHQQNEHHHQQQQGAPTANQALVSLYQNLAAVQQQQAQQQHHHQQPQFEHNLTHHHHQQQALISNTSLDQLLNSGPMDLAAAAQFQQELAIRLQQQQQHQQQQQRQEEENRRRTVAAALAAAAEIHQQQQHHQQLQGVPGKVALQHNAASVPASNQLGDEQCSADFHLPSHPHHQEEEDSASPSESKSTTQTDGGTSSGSPSSETTVGGSRKQRKPSKTSKVDQISVRLQSKCSTPDNNGQGEAIAGDENGGKAELNAPSSSTLPHISSIEVGSDGGNAASMASILMHLKNQMQDHHSAGDILTQSAISATCAQQQNATSPSSMPYTCQHCMLGFQDRALYQIHLGYHGYESPFKCNRCGHQSSSSLEFNLHLYQAKHD